MKFLPKISIVIPSYNKVKYISQTLESIVVQNYPNLEIIIQDGDSTDGSVDIIKKYADKYPKIISWESKKDKGQVDAINKGMKKAKGDILAYINADDVYEKGSLHAVGEYFAENPETLWLVGRGKIIDEKGAEIAKFVTSYKNLLLNLNSYNLLLIVNYLVQSSVFLGKKAFYKFGPFVGNHGIVVEYEMWLKLGKLIMPQVLNSDLSSFRLTSDNISATQFSEVLAFDFRTVRRYTNSYLLLFLHYLHNLGRIGTLAVFK